MLLYLNPVAVDLCLLVAQSTIYRIFIEVILSLCLEDLFPLLFSSLLDDSYFQREPTG